MHYSSHPDQAYVVPCEWNYRTDYCHARDSCETFDGVKLLHGTRMAFHRQIVKDPHPIFYHVYEAFNEVCKNFKQISILKAFSFFFQYVPGTDPYVNIVKNIENRMTVPKTNCDKLLNKFLYHPREIFSDKSFRNPFKTPEEIAPKKKCYCECDCKNK